MLKFTYGGFIALGTQLLECEQIFTLCGYDCARFNIVFLLSCRSGGLLVLSAFNPTLDISGSVRTIVVVAIKAGSDGCCLLNGVGIKVR